MTDQHPLTDEMCEGLMERTSKYPYTDDVIVDMRAAYDLAIEHVKNVIELKLEVLSGEWRLDQYETSIAIEDFCKDLIQTMRPQVVDLPQANSDVCGEEGIERARQQTFEENDELMHLLSDS